MVGILADDAPQVPAVQKIVFAFTQMQYHLSATVRFFNRLQRIVSLPARFPSNAVLRRQAGAPGNERHLVRGDKSRIKTNPELPDQMRILGLIARQ